MLNISFALSFYSIGCSTFSVYTYILTPYSYPSLDTPFEESMGIGYSKIDREIPIELNKEIPICVKIGTSSNRMEVLDITEDFRKIECDAGIAVTITVSDEIVE